MTAEIPPHWIHEETLGPREVGKIFDVDARTVVRWADSGLLGFFRTPNGQRRFPVCEVKRLVAGNPSDDPQLLIDLAKIDKEKYAEKWRGGWRRDPRVTKRVGVIDNPDGEAA